MEMLEKANDVTGMATITEVKLSITAMAQVEATLEAAWQLKRIADVLCHTREPNAYETQRGLKPDPLLIATLEALQFSLNNPPSASSSS